jgi:hypothetical protein
MSNHNLFLAIVKIVGLYLFLGQLVQVFNLWQLITLNGDILYLMANATAHLVVLIVLALAVANADILIRLLKLEKGFDAPILETASISDQKLVGLGCIFIGGTMLIYPLAAFLEIGIILFQNSLHYTPSPWYELSNFTRDAIEIGIGILLIAYRKHLAHFLVAREKKGMGN